VRILKRHDVPDPARQQKVNYCGRCHSIPYQPIVLIEPSPNGAKFVTGKTWTWASITGDNPAGSHELSGSFDDDTTVLNITVPPCDKELL